MWSVDSGGRLDDARNRRLAVLEGFLGCTAVYVCGPGKDDGWPHVASYCCTISFSLTSCEKGRRFDNGTVGER